ncbi:MAG: hypothetical protein KJO98_15680 [Rhodothermia bacterium]|nr:hypothetical protein [Rhodothermia bacterium]
MTRNISVIAVLALFVLGVVFIPVEVSFDFTVDGRVIPAREWALYRSRNDGIETALRDNLRGGVTQYTVNRFAGGDAARLTLEPGLQVASAVQHGDTVASIYSSELAREYAALGGQLAVALASLDLYTTGDKEPVIEEERLKLAQAEEVARQHRLELQRLRQLRSENLISEQELEFSESEQRVLDAGVEVAQARFETVRSGAKPEQIEFTRAQVRSLRQEIGTIADKLRLSTITSPISGRIARSFGSDTLLAAYDTTSFVAVMAVPVERMLMVSAGDTVMIRTRTTDRPQPAVVYQADDAVHVMGGREMVLINAVLRSPSRGLVPGSQAACTISAGKVPLKTYLKELLASSA